MRKLRTHDVFIAMNIINTAGIKEEFSKMSLKVANKKNVNLQEVGLDFLLSVLGGCANRQSEVLIYDFIGGLLEISPEEVENMEPLELLEEIKKLNEVISVEAWKSFFMSLKKLLTQN